MMYTMPKNLLSICVNFALATQHELCNIYASLTHKRQNIPRERDICQFQG